MSFIQRQGADVATWTSAQSESYKTAQPRLSLSQCQIAASLDCALWQHEPRSEATDRPAMIRELIDLLRFLQRATIHHILPKPSVGFSGG